MTDRLNISYCANSLAAALHRALKAGLLTKVGIDGEGRMSGASRISVKWIDRFREPTQPPNPKYPNGMDVDMAKDARQSCLADLPYPAKRCGYYSVLCETCGFTALITTAGRADDPRTVKLPCKPTETRQ